MAYEFTLDERLGIELPVLHKDWEQYSDQQQAEILHGWEIIRGRIPDRIKALETIIIEKQSQLNVEMNFARSCQLNYEISELASAITDLHLWYRSSQDMSDKAHH